MHAPFPFSLSLFSPLLVSSGDIPLRLHSYCTYHNPAFPLIRTRRQGGEGQKKGKEIIIDRLEARDALAVPVIADIDVSDTTGMGQTRVTCHQSSSLIELVLRDPLTPAFIPLQHLLQPSSPLVSLPLPLDGHCSH